jgi:hypothetical protein
LWFAQQVECWALSLEGQEIPPPHHCLAAFLANVALAKSKGLGVPNTITVKEANTMIMERGARPDALPDAHARHITPLKWKTAVRLIVAALVGAVLGIAVGYSVQLG